MTTNLSSQDLNELLYGLHTTTQPTRLWSRANLGEAVTDPMTPLCWSVWHHGFELGAREAYADFGIIDRSNVISSADPNECIAGCFYGRMAMNIDLTRALMAAVPGASGDDFERDIVGRLRPNRPPDRKTLARVPAIARKAPPLFLRAASTTTRAGAEQLAWWQREVLNAGDGSPNNRFAESLRRFRSAVRMQSRSRFVVMTVQSQLVALSISAGDPSLANRITSGIGGIAETVLADDLWLASRGRLSLSQLLRDYGYYGVNIGNMTGRSWRQEPAHLEKLLAGLARDTSRDRPRDREAAATRDRNAALSELTTRLPRRRRTAARFLAASAATQYRALEIGKASYLMALDGCRAAAEDIGRELVTDRMLDHHLDVLFLSHHEFGQSGLDLRAKADERSRAWAGLKNLSLPAHFEGEPAIKTEAAHVQRSRLDGVAGCGGIAEGVARLISDSAGDLEPGEVLVCPFTDPSWTPLMAIAAAVVVDVGGPASHGAVVARELGLPCVLGTQDAMSQIKTGDRIRVDGNNGVVEILNRAR